MVQRPLPDAAGEARFPVLVHQLEEVGLVALFVLAPRLGFHRRAPGVGLHAAAPPAGALGAAALDDHVPYLAGGAAAEPRLAAEDEAAADAGSPEDPDQALELLTGTEVELGFGRDLDVVADSYLGPERPFEVVGQGERALPAGEVLRRGDDSGLLVGVAGGADPDPGQLRRSRRRLPWLPPAAPSPSPRRRPRARRWSASAGAPARHLAAPVDDRGLDLRPTEVDTAAQVSHARSLCGVVLCRL